MLCTARALRGRQMSIMASQVIGKSIVCLIACLRQHQRKHQSVPPPPPPPPLIHPYTHTQRASSAGGDSISWPHSGNTKCPYITRPQWLVLPPYRGFVLRKILMWCILSWCDILLRHDLAKKKNANQKRSNIGFLTGDVSRDVSLQIRIRIKKDIQMIDYLTWHPEIQLSAGW